MAQRDQGRESPRSQYPPHHGMEGNSPRNQYPPPTGGDDRSRHPQSSQAPVTLPPIRDPGSGYSSQQSYTGSPLPAPANGYAQGPPPPQGANGYTGPQNGPSSLPPFQPPRQGVDPRSPGYSAQGDRRDEYYQQRPPYDRDPYYSGYRGHPPPPDYPRDYGRGQPPPHDDYRRDHGPPRHDPNYPPRGPYEADYANGGHARNGYPPYQQAPPPPQAAPLQQAAPRQRTSIACRYCRKRKIRCSGYQNAPGGRCVNCTRMNQECIFQPVSSSSSAAFVHVSAVPGGIAPGTPLYGAYGQPLPQGPGGPPQQPPPGPPPAGAPQGASYAPAQAVQSQQPYYPQPVRSPTDVHSPYAESDAASASGRRRRRESEEGHERRLPPPSGHEEELWRRSPVSGSGSPRSQYYPSQGPLPAPPGSSAGTHTPPISSTGPTPPQRSPATSHSSTPNGHGSSTNGATPTPQAKALSPLSAGASSVMSVKSILGDSPAHDMDRNMLGRLNRSGR
ncbi:hypothetical protein jhhlp_001388 [Lomentospora prolificans]|uniref:Zn(2)-C6 fungal-type domain-containing protein n=1 Tax=Lomentospora prolificans TaxID=41688 RepID=A0A2N3NIB2_9PEZI|nr:hypothetical protein jhhlp_001388 [Lomentospora prolificans]